MNSFSAAQVIPGTQVPTLMIDPAQSQPVIIPSMEQTQPVQAQPVQAQPIQAQPVQTQPIQPQPPTEPQFSQLQAANESQVAQNVPLRDMSRKERDALAPMEKHGNKEDGTHAAHILSQETFIEAQHHQRGRPVTNRDEETNTMQVLNSAANLRIKTETGNLETDRKHDQGIAETLNTHESLNKGDGARAVQQMKFANAHKGESRRSITQETESVSSL